MPKTPVTPKSYHVHYGVFQVVPWYSAILWTPGSLLWASPVWAPECVAASTHRDSTPTSTTMCPGSSQTSAHNKQGWYQLSSTCWCVSWIPLLCGPVTLPKSIAYPRSVSLLWIGLNMIITFIGVHNFIAVFSWSSLPCGRKMTNMYTSFPFGCFRCP